MKHKSNTTKRGFTVIELMVVVVIVGIMAAFAVPNYQKSVRKAHERDALRQLELLHGSLALYHAREGQFVPGTNLTINDLNNALGINISPNELDFDYDQVSADAYDIAVEWDESGSPLFTMLIDETPISGTNPCCNTGSTCKLVSMCP